MFSDSRAAGRPLVCPATERQSLYVSNYGCFWGHIRLAITRAKGNHPQHGYKQGPPPQNHNEMKGMDCPWQQGMGMDSVLPALTLLVTNLILPKLNFRPIFGILQGLFETTGMLFATLSMPDWLLCIVLPINILGMPTRLISFGTYASEHLGSTRFTLRLPRVSTCPQTGPL